MEDRVILPKERYNLNDLGQLYASSDICILASAFEGLGMGVLEMMQSGVPIIASNTVGIDEIITDHNNGLLFPEGNSKTLAKKIVQLLTSPNLRKNLVKSANLILKKKFSLQKYILFHSKIYNNLLRKK